MLCLFVLKIDWGPPPAATSTCTTRTRTLTFWVQDPQSLRTEFLKGFAGPFLCSDIHVHDPDAHAESGLTNADRRLLIGALEYKDKRCGTASLNPGTQPQKSLCQAHAQCGPCTMWDTSGLCERSAHAVLTGAEGALPKLPSMATTVCPSRWCSGDVQMELVQLMVEIYEVGAVWPA